MMAPINNMYGAPGQGMVQNNYHNRGNYRGNNNRGRGGGRGGHRGAPMQGGPNQYNQRAPIPPQPMGQYPPGMPY